MKIYAINGMQSHSESVKKNVSLVGSVILRGIEVYGVIQLLEGSHRMAHAIDLGLPINIVLFNDDEVIPHDCDDIESHTTGLPDYATTRELAHALIIERGLRMNKVPVYESGDYNNIKILRPTNKTGTMIYECLIKNSPFSTFPQKIWEVVFGEVKDVVGKHILVLGNENPAKSFKVLGADITYIDMDIHQKLSAKKLFCNQFDLIYASDINRNTDISDLFSMYKRLLNDGGLAVTLNDEQTSEIISDFGLSIYWFSEAHERYPKVSFLRK